MVSENGKPDTYAVGTAFGSPERFGYEWHNYSEMRPEYEEQFRRWTAPLEPEDWRGKDFLDVGCGMGRNSFWPLSYGASSGLSIDIDDRSLAAARKTLSRYPNASVQHLSAYDIDFVDGFDIVFSIGVIHHLEFPERAVWAMTKAVKPGGQVLIWVYGRENNEWIVNLIDPLRKMLFSRLPIGLLHHLSLYPSIILWLTLRLGVGKVQYFNMIRSFSFRHLRSIVFDQMLPKIAHYWSKDEAENLLRRTGLCDVHATWVNEVSWSVIGRRAHESGAQATWTRIFCLCCVAR